MVKSDVFRLVTVPFKSLFKKNLFQISLKNISRSTKKVKMDVKVKPRANFGDLSKLVRSNEISMGHKGLKTNNYLASFSLITVDS